MSAPYSAPRRLERSRSDRFIGGVCGGIAKYLNMDPTLVRILTVVITLFTFVPVIAYVIAMFVMPEEGTDSTNRSVNAFGAQNGYPTYPAQNGAAHNGPAGDGSTGSDPVWGATGAPWEQPQTQPADPTKPTGTPQGQSTPR